jgi:hypothetical protein
LEHFILALDDLAIMNGPDISAVLDSDGLPVLQRIICREGKNPVCPCKRQWRYAL